MTDGTGNRDEQQTIALILSGQSSLFHDLIRPYEAMVYRMALGMMKNEADAEDVAQEAFLNAYRNLAKFRADAKFSTWLAAIALNEARNRLRRAGAMPMESLDLPEDEAHITPALLRDWREVPSEALERNELRALLFDAVEALPPVYREVFLLRDVQEESIQDAAVSLGISENLVKVRLHRARLTLQKKLAPQLKQMNPKRRWFQWF